MPDRSSLGAAASFLIALCACDSPTPAPTGRAGDPLPGLSAAQLSQFEAGRATFQRTFTPAEGLGPTFNEPRCSSCHDLPTIGGAGADGVRKATRFVEDRCDLLLDHGGDMLQTQITDALRQHGFDVEPVPSDATAVVSITAPPLYGAGLVEAIADEAILELADPDDADGDGISGRPGSSADGRLGRFGWKANFATIRNFIGVALLGEMGLTSPGHPAELRIGAHPLPPATDPLPEPEVGDELVDHLAAYVRLLAQPAPEPASRAGRDSIEDGRRAFRAIGCDRCHKPELRTRSSEIEPINRRRVMLYSDLLLHDMGPENASICSPGAAPAEWRTPPLIGLRLRIHLWHDGRAQSIDSAIRAHGGEAAPARDRFMTMADANRASLLRFLGSL